jgi:imidazoleglycerol phosphate synthase glutamine amidotransferase subunit HisH
MLIGCRDRQFYRSLAPGAQLEIEQVAFAGTRLTAAVWQGAIAACQFHPEKSGLAGQHLLQRWLAWVASRP